MKYSVLINQYGAFKAGLIGKTDFNDWAIIEYVRDFYSNPTSKKLEDHVWINYAHMLSEMPLMTLNKKQSISNRMRKIEGLGLVTTIKDSNGKLYAKLTKLAYEATTCKAVPKQEHPVPKQEHPVPKQEHPVPEKGHITEHHLTDHQVTEKDTPKAPTESDCTESHKPESTANAADSVDCSSLIASSEKQEQAFAYIWENMGFAKNGKQAGRKAFLKTCKKMSVDELRSHTAMIVSDLRKRFSAIEGKKSPFSKMHLSTYINGKGWEDEDMPMVFETTRTANHATHNPENLPVDENGDYDFIALAAKNIKARQESIEQFGF